MNKNQKHCSLTKDFKFPEISCYGNYSKQKYEVCEKYCNKNEQLKCKEKEDKLEKQKLEKLDIKPFIVLTKFNKGCAKCG